VTANRARALLLFNTAGATGYAVLHLYLAWARNVPINVNFVLLVALAVVAYLATRIEHGLGLAIYSVTLWFAITVMTVNFASDPRCSSVPGVVMWLAFGAVIAGASDNRAGIIYAYLSTVSFLWIVLVYGDSGYALVRWPLVIGAVVVGYIYREFEDAKGQLKLIETALGIMKNASPGRKSP